jgi:hypothetical protein
MKKSLLYWIPNGLLLLMMAGTGIMYLVQPEEAANAFVQLGYPAYTMYFNAAAKILGGIVIVWPGLPTWMKEFAYAGYLYILLLASQAVLMSMPGIPWPMLIPIGIWALAYWQFRKRARA